MALRFLPSLAGALLPLIIFLLLLELRIKPLYAFAGGIFITFENALLAQSHYILLDSFLLLFGFTSLLFYLKYINDQQRSKKYLLLTGIFSGLALSIKWVALSFIGLPLLFEGVRILQDKRITLKELSRANSLAVYLLIVPSLIYFSVFMVDFSILNKTGTGDAFMGPGFQKTLIGSNYANDTSVKPSTSLQKFLELNSEMYNANQRLDATHPYSSTWYTWPFMTRPIYYWVNENSRIYLLGNPIIWWLSTVAILFLILNILRDTKTEIRNFVPMFLISGFIVNLLPFVGVKRVMFLYHYFTAYLFAIMATVYLLDQWQEGRYSRPVLGVLFAVILIIFLFFAPLSYGIELSPSSFDMRMWFSSWE